MSRETAARRRRESVPARIVAHRKPPRKLLDFGCGLSRDVEYYRSRGIDATGYDPYHQPLNLKPLARTFDVVTCTYVLNTLPPGPRSEALSQIRRLLAVGGRLVLSVRTRPEVERERRADWQAEEDGWRTHRGTFQRGYSSDEVGELLEREGFVDPVFLRLSHGITVEARLAC